MWFKDLLIAAKGSFVTNHVHKMHCLPHSSRSSKNVVHWINFLYLKFYCSSNCTLLTQWLKIIKNVSYLNHAIFRFLTFWRAKRTTIGGFASIHKIRLFGDFWTLWLYQYKAFVLCCKLHKQRIFFSNSHVQCSQVVTVSFMVEFPVKNRKKILSLHSPAAYLQCIWSVSTYYSILLSTFHITDNGMSDDLWSRKNTSLPIHFPANCC